MGKSGGGSGSWLSSVKKAFKSSPTKVNKEKQDSNNGSSCRRRDESELEDEDDKRRGKRRWGLWKSSCQDTVIQCDGKNNNNNHVVAHSQPKAAGAVNNTQKNVASDEKVDHSVSEAAYVEQRQALAVAMASTVAAGAAVASAQAAVEVIRRTHSPVFLRRVYAAVVIQTAFRGYLARKALRALRGLVKLQALVRGYIVRNRAKMTLHCMQALFRAQTRVKEQRRRLSYEGSRDSNCRWESNVADRKQNSRNSTNAEEDWYEQRAIQEVQSLMEKTKEAALKREKALAYAFSRQMLRFSRDSYASETEAEERPEYVDRWMSNQYDRTGRASCDRRESMKTVHIDTSHSYTAPSLERSHQASYQHQLISQYSNPRSATSDPHHMERNRIPLCSPRTPISSRIKHIQVHSAGPLLQREEMGYSKSQTPNLGSVYYRGLHEAHHSGTAAATSAPNYMAATASAKARVRSQSVPRHPPEILDADKRGTVKKRLLFPVPDPYFEANVADEDHARNMRTTRHLGQRKDQLFTEPRSTISSCCTDSNGEDLSPPSTNNLRRWLR